MDKDSKQGANRGGDALAPWAPPRVFVLPAVLLAAAIIAGVFLAYTGNAPDRGCVSELHAIGEALSVWAASHNGEYPDPNLWCDILAGRGLVSARTLRCPNVYGGPSSFALNPDASPSSPADVVLVFESIRGWNEWGGPELLSDWAHKRRRWHILFCDMHTGFVAEKDLPGLRWSDNRQQKQEDPNGKRQ